MKNILQALLVAHANAVADNHLEIGEEILRLAVKIRKSPDFEPKGPTIVEIPVDHPLADLFRRMGGARNPFCGCVGCVTSGPHEHDECHVPGESKGN